MWKDEGLCKGKSETFYYERDGKTVNKIKEAKAICAECPVLKECREFIKKDGDHYGIWAGLTPKERKALGWWRFYERI